jgi:hypothetical protein
MEIEFGHTYTDSITGFEGVATGKANYMTGCEQILLEPVVGDDGRPGEGKWVDIDRLKGFESVQAVGGPRSDAPVR